MLNFRFTKTQNAVFISHIDVLRSINRTLRRMGIPVKYSQGFNPHMLVNLSQPLVTGVRSLAEWATFDTDFDNEKEFINLYNKNCPEGFEALECIVTKQKPKIAGKVTASDYVIECSHAYQFKESIEKLNKQEFLIEIEKKNQIKEMDVAERIHSIKVDKERIYARLSFGNINLRVDKFCQKLNEIYNLQIKLMDITRKTQLIELGDEYITVSDYLKGI